MARHAALMDGHAWTVCTLLSWVGSKLLGGWQTTEDSARNPLPARAGAHG
jgi:hypothetical protein